MLDSLLKSKFYTKCKTNIKLVKTRLETIKKKKNSVQKFLKNDIADLLRNGLDKNAYGRAEGLLIEQNMACCYELIDNFCGNILSNSNISLMQKQKECPEECREAIASLIFAAARFADLPELRDLRNIFNEKYGNSLQDYTNQVLVERLSPMTFTKEMKLQLLQDIANENSIEWNSKALEQQLFTPPTIQDEARTVPVKDNDVERDSLSHARRRSTEDGFARRRNAEEKEQPGQRASNVRHYNIAKARPSSSEDDDMSVTDFSQDDRKISSSSAGSVSEEDSSRRPFQGRMRPPPYLKQKPEKYLFEEAEEEEDKPKPKPMPRSVRRRNDGGNSKLPPPPGRDYLRRGPREEDEDEEEKKLDGLLLHYSNKTSSYEGGGDEANGRYIRGRRPETAPGPARATSLPSEATGTESEEKRGPARAASFQPDGGNIIHPKLPGDYDELAARIAALRGK